MNTVREALAEALKMLTEVDTPFLDASLLLAHALGISREKLLASYPEELPLSAQNEFRGYVEKRLSGYPVSYIRHKKEFFGLPFYVDERVLVPRPETETLVELVLQYTDVPGTVPQILDVGTGSGCIAITLKYLRPAFNVTACDYSRSALAVCGMNSRHLLSEPLPMVESNLFSNIDGSFDVIVSNPPYLTSREVENMEKHRWPEPHIALAGGSTGLDIVEPLIEEGFFHLNRGGTMFIEVGIDQIAAVKELFHKKGYHEVKSYHDLSGRDRVVSGHKPDVEQN